MGVGIFPNVVTRPKYPPYWETGVATPLSQQTFAATLPLLSVKMVYGNPKTGLERRVLQKELASEVYRAIGGVARKSITNRAIVGH